MSEVHNIKKQTNLLLARLNWYGEVGRFKFTRTQLRCFQYHIEALIRMGIDVNLCRDSRVTLSTNRLKKIRRVAHTHKCHVLGDFLDNMVSHNRHCVVCTERQSPNSIYCAKHRTVVTQCGESTTCSHSVSDALSNHDMWCAKHISFCRDCPSVAIGPGEYWCVFHHNACRCKTPIPVNATWCASHKPPRCKGCDKPIRDKPIPAKKRWCGAHHPRCYYIEKWGRCLYTQDDETKWCRMHASECQKEGCSSRVPNCLTVCDTVCLSHTNECVTLDCTQQRLKRLSSPYCLTHVKKCHQCKEPCLDEWCNQHKFVCTNKQGCTQRCSRSHGKVCSQHQRKCITCQTPINTTNSRRHWCSDHLIKCGVRCCTERVRNYALLCLNHKPVCVGCGVRLKKYGNFMKNVVCSDCS